MAAAKWRGPVGLAILVLWSASLLLPAIQLCAVHPEMSIARFSRNGLWFLLGGPAALFEGALGWLANPLIVAASALLLNGRKPWLLLSFGCLAFALLGWWQSYRIFELEHGPFRNCGADLGLWLWLAASSLSLGHHALERFGRLPAAPLQDWV